MSVELNKEKTSKENPLMKELEELKLKNQLLNQKLQDISQHSKYLLADFENYRKQMSKQLEKAIDRANNDLLLDVLNVVDDFERALPLIQNQEDLKGLKIVYKNLEKLLQKYNVKKIECLNQKVDPNYHEVLFREESDIEDNIILEELQKGYLCNDKVLRHSKVKVSHKPLSQKTKQEDIVDDIWEE